MAEYVEPPPYLERRRIEEGEYDKTKFPNKTCFVLHEFACDRENRLASLKAQHLVRKNSRLQFDMFFDHDGKKATNKYVFFFDKARTKIAYVAKINPHPRIHHTSGEMLPPLAGNGNHAYNEFLLYAAIQVPRPSSALRIIRDIPEKFWETYGMEADKTFLRAGETFWKDGAGAQSSIEHIIKRRRSQAMEIESASVPVASVASVAPVTHAASFTELRPISIDSPCDSPCEPPCKSPMRSIGTPRAHQLKSYPRAPSQPWTSQGLVPTGSTPKKDWKAVKPLKVRTKDAKLLRSNAVIEAQKLLDTASVNLSPAQFKHHKQEAKQKRKTARETAREEKASVVQAKQDKKQHAKTVKDEKDERAAAKIAMKAVVVEPAVDEEGALTSPKFVSEAYFPYVSYDQGAWERKMDGLSEYNELRQARVKRGLGGEVMRKNDRVLKPGLKITLTSYKALCEEDDAWFAYLREQHRLDQRNEPVERSGRR